MGVALLVIGILAIIGVSIWYGWWAKKKRQEALAIAARQLGLQYSPVDTFNCLGLPFGLFSRGDGRGTENVLWGTWQNLNLREFEYWYYEETTDSEGHTSRSYSHFSCVVTEIPMQSAGLSITKENIFTRFADHVGLRDIEFESEQFNRAYNIKSRDKKFANDVVDARMMQWLMQSGEGYAFEMNGPYVLVYCKRRRPNELAPLLGSLQQYIGHIPKVAYSLHGDAAAAARMYGTAPEGAPQPGGSPLPPPAGPPVAGGPMPPEGAMPPPPLGPAVPPPASPGPGSFQP
ncbi:MAG TPA: hypothetical protein VNN79_08125 [Actinomycetota bacterium]|nr:hypothetical protein [Actinomycetota bacterium]